MSDQSPTPTPTSTPTKPSLRSLCFRLLWILIVGCVVSLGILTLANYIELRYSPMGQAIAQGVGKQITAIRSGWTGGAEKIEGRIESAERVWDGLEPRLAIEWRGTMQTADHSGKASGHWSIAARDLSRCYVEGGTSPETGGGWMLLHDYLDSLQTMLLTAVGVLSVLRAFEYIRSRREYKASLDSA